MLSEQLASVISFSRISETAYVLAYSVIMLNTDLYNPGVRSRMTLEEFISNNRGINDNADVPREILEDFYHDIATNEIRMQDEVDVAKETILTSSTTTSGVLGLTSGLQNALVSAGITRDARREAYQQAIEEIGSKTEAMFSNMLASRRRAGERCPQQLCEPLASHYPRIARDVESGPQQRMH